MDQTEYYKKRNEKIQEMFRLKKSFSLVFRTLAIDSNLVKKVCKEFLMAQENISEEYAIRKIRIWESEDPVNKVSDEEFTTQLNKILI